jgi:hypothetical protein
LDMIAKKCITVLLRRQESRFSINASQRVFTTVTGVLSRKRGKKIYFGEPILAL